MIFLLFVARAIENQCYVIAAAQYGQHNDKRVSYGHSLVVDGWGTIIADAGGMDSPQPNQPSTQPKIITCDIDLSTIESIRERMPIQQHRENAQF
jgi:deaminated glutathione amidase